MPQTVVTLAAEIDPERADDARALIEALRRFVEGDGAVPGAQGDRFKPLAASLPGLHFASIMVFDDERFDPLLTLELNFDGPTRAFLPSLQTPTLTPYLRKVLACCKPPENAEALRKYQSAIGQGALAPYLETLVVAPAVYHQGNRGLERQRILDEAALYDDVQKTLDAPAFTAPDDAVALHKTLRGRMLAAHGCLGRRAPDRIAWFERALDVAKLALLIWLVVAVLLLPGLLLAAASPLLGEIVGWSAIALVVCEGMRFGMRQKRQPASGPPRAAQLPPKGPLVAWDGNAVILAGIALPVLAVLVLGLFWPMTRAADAGALLGVAGVLHALRRMETTDRVHVKPKIDPVRLREIMELEDQIKQNHMGSVVHVKPGILRAILIRLGLRALGLLLRVTANDGYLANMRTIHFAHWALLDNGSRLLFFSNFDSSWESYLDDFIEKAHAGLTLAWSNGIGFPRTRFLVEDGATNGPLFKTWARHSMARGLFWVSAYPELSVNQIERNCAIAAGLRAPALSTREAVSWASLL